ncbi:hypothetical protein CTE07_09360 [Chitinophaga terrae (ex Kim and Jung 2007)]|nr:hypothetical protein CTE07_09360 [Chitinophaga terrae (ex Kim and Jung 2007)]
MIPLTGKVADSLEQYVLQERGTARYTGTAFKLNSKCRAMRGDSYVALLKSLLRKAGMRKHISPHYLRHSIATHLLQSGMSMEYVRDFLGHKCLESTAARILSITSFMTLYEYLEGRYTPATAESYHREISIFLSSYTAAPMAVMRI